MEDDAFSIGEHEGRISVVTGKTSGAIGVSYLTPQRARDAAATLLRLASRLDSSAGPTPPSTEPGPSPEQWAFRPGAETGTDGATDEDLAAARAEYVADYARVKESLGWVPHDAISPVHLVVQRHMAQRKGT